MPSLWVIRKLLCFHAIQHNPYQNQVYRYPGAHFGLSFHILFLTESSCREVMRVGRGSFHRIYRWRRQGPPPSQEPITENNLPLAIFSQAIQQETCKHHSTNQSTVANAEEMYLANRQAPHPTWLCLNKHICRSIS